MADVTVAPLVPGASGAAESAQTLNGADTFQVANNDKMCLRFEETSGTGTSTVTIETTLTVGGLAVADQTISMTSGSKKYAGPFPRSLYGDPVNVTCTDGDVDMQPVQL